LREEHATKKRSAMERSSQRRHYGEGAAFAIAEKGHSSIVFAETTEEKNPDSNGKIIEGKERK